jgi:hypothetical protein
VAIPEATQAPIPSTGVQVHVNYLGGWKGTYGLSSDLKSVRNSGDRVFEIVNASGAIEANIEKTDSSTKREIIVEIYRDGTLLTRGATNAAFGKVSLAADATTGVAKTPVTSASVATAATATTTAAPAASDTPAMNTTANAT